MTPTKGLRFEGVDFQFLSPGGGADGIDDTLTGTVLIRDGAMILDLSEEPRARCLIDGRVANHVYVGRNTLRHVDASPVNARWADLGGGTYVGMWVDEDGKQLFTFRLPKSGETGAPRKPTV